MSVYSAIVCVRTLKWLQVFVEVNGEQLLRMSDENDENVIPVFQESTNRLFFLEMLVHCADISNPIKPFDICEKWAYLVCEEFFAQGDKERLEGQPISPMMDKSKVNIPTMQCNFIDFVITPLYLSKSDMRNCAHTHHHIHIQRSFVAFHRFTCLAKTWVEILSNGQSNGSTNFETIPMAPTNSQNWKIGS